MVTEGLFLAHNGKELKSLGGPEKTKYAAIAALNPDVPFEQVQRELFCEYCLGHSNSRDTQTPSLPCLKAPVKPISSLIYLVKCHLCVINRVSHPVIPTSSITALCKGTSISEYSRVR